ncbi:MAG: hypothetical protein MK324_17265 [Pirellulales bacterium]|nr:hypothetical protein [Pirellulales bacterium]
MFDQKVHLKSLRVVQARGITRDNQFQLSDLKNVNVIYGRNGVGKSTVGLAIYKLLRPSDKLLGKSAEVGGVVCIGGTTLDLQVSVSQGYASVGGVQQDYPDFKSAGELSRYRLALEELISEDDVEFAKIIADETRGGFDLRAVAKRVDAREKPPRPAKLEAEWKNLHRLEEERREHQVDIARKEKRLATLREDRAGLREKLDLQDALKAARSAQKYKVQLNELHRELGEFPETIGRLSGGEAENLSELQMQVAKAQSEVERCKDTEEAMREEFEALKYLESVTRLDLSRLEELQTQFTETQRKLETVRSQGASLEAEMCALASAFTGGDSPEEFSDRLGDIDLSELDTVYPNYVRKQQQVWAAEGTLNHLQTEVPKDIGAEELKLRYHRLQDWCGAVDEVQHKPVANRLTIASSIVMFVWALVLGSTVSPYWFGALLAPLIFYILYRRVMRGNEHRYPTRQQLEAAEALRYPELTEWSSENVQTLMASLSDQIQETVLNQRKYQRYKRAQENLQADQRQFEDAKNTLADAAARFGIDLTGLDSEQKLLRLMNSLVHWKAASAKHSGVKATLIELEGFIESTKDLIFRELEAFQVDVGDSTTSYRAEVSEAAVRLADFHDAQHRLVSAGRATDLAKSGVKQAQAQVEVLLKKLGSASLTVSTLEELEEQRAAYELLRQQRSEADTLLREAQMTIDSCPQVKLLNATQIDEHLDECDTAQERLQLITEQIQEVHTEIGVIQQGTALADAMADKDEKGFELREHFHDALDGLAAYCLVDYLVKETEGENASLVFEKAAANLHRITGGKMTLDVVVNEEGEEFVISDAIGVRRGLEALSVGERVQVLLAVRLAFLSTGETSALPIVVDEALGTADDDRAHEMIESFVKLALDGRQVFYFTAQTDEVEKWQAVLSRHEGLDGKFIDLDEMRSRTPNDNLDHTLAFVERNTVPEPSGMSHAEYGKMLGISLPGAREFSFSSLTLWAVLDDVDDLYGCWLRRIRSVGMLEEVIRRHEMAPLDAEAARVAIIRARALEAAVEQYWSGRPAPLELTDLEQSEAFPERWLDQIWSLAGTVGYDGAGLIEALRRGEVKRWRQDYSDSLESSLRTTGRIVDRENATADEIESVASAVFVREELELDHEMPWLLTRLFQILGDYRSTGVTDG